MELDEQEDVRWDRKADVKTTEINQEQVQKCLEVFVSSEVILLTMFFCK